MNQPDEPSRSTLQSIKHYILIGFLVLIPIWITLKLLGIFLSFLHEQATPMLEQIVLGLGSGETIFHQLVSSLWFQTFVAILLLLIFFYIVGWLASLWIGRQLITLIDKIMDRIPIAKSIYGAIKGMADAVQNSKKTASKVVLLNFPTSSMMTVGLVTRMTKDSNTGEDLAVVFVPNCPAPTAGFLEIVPVSQLVFTDWTVEDAMSFLISGGTDLPPEISLKEKPLSHTK